MLFTSYEFIAFAAAVLLLYYLVPKRLQWVLLLASSYLFYAFSGLPNLAFIAVSTLSCFFIARVMAKRKAAEDAYVAKAGDSLSKEERKAYRAGQKKKRFRVLLFGLIFNLGILAVIKYTAFAIENVNGIIALFGVNEIGVPDMLMPMGISFYIFSSCGYLIDIYRGKTQAEKNIGRYALFVSFFPQLVQGPISRHGELAAQLTTPHSFDGKTIKFGLQRVLWGYFKKLVIADRVMVAVKTLLLDTAEYNGAYTVLLILLYSVQIYADFTGGIDITIGIAESMGIRLAENFKRPFSSTSTKEYWNRWHITMGTWFTDYIFNPLSVSGPMLKLSKFCRTHLKSKVGAGVAKRISVYISTAVTWFLTGLWHGAAWNFIVWGMLNCLVILVSRELEPLYKRFRVKFPQLVASYPYHCFAAVRTFLLMGLIRSLDCYANVPLTFKMWGSMLTTFNWGRMLGGGFLDLGLGAADYIIVFVSVALVFAVSKLSEKRDIREALQGKTVLSWALTGTLLLAVLLFGAYGIGYDASQFIYNQF